MIATGHPWSKLRTFERRLRDIRDMNREGAEVLLANARLPKPATRSSTRSPG
jgi:hypothetical protein